MAKPSKEKNASEVPSVSKIYETIQSQDFLRELWWDLISDIDEKPTYKRLKNMVIDVLNNTKDTLVSVTTNSKEEIKRRDALSHISIMTFTVDTVLSEVLFRKYEREFENIVKNLIKDLIKNKTKEDTNSDESEFAFENIENFFNEDCQKLAGKKENNHPISGAKKSQASNLSEGVGQSNVVLSPKRGRPKKNSINEKKAENVNAVLSPKKGRPKKINMNEIKAENVNAVPKTKRGALPKTPKKSITESFDGINSQESDAKSEVSIGNISVDSVSSVHTSELSSYEDTISICSDDEGNKERISLKVANEMYLRGKLSQIYHIGKRSKRYKEVLEASSSKTQETKTNDSKSGSVISSPRKVLPQRIRKPNSKYSSETMYCEVKDYSSPPPDTGSSSSQDELNNKSFATPKVLRKRKRLSLDKASTSTPTSKSSVLPTTSSKRMKTNSP